MPSTSIWSEIEDIFNVELQKALHGEFELEEALQSVDKSTEDTFRRASGAGDP